ncbi:hypothetical protein [Alkalihalobacillus sp. 1P02AB]|uniref:hypothetical protein n=1 Tax=Alkalihalobacillus sp. 1P02AB TaxID=3132260 RepID=UPI0039A73A01
MRIHKFFTVFVAVFAISFAVTGDRTSAATEGSLLEIGPSCVDPGFTVVNQGVITNAQLGELIPELQNTSTGTGAATVVLGYIGSLGVPVGGSLGAVSFLATSMMYSQANMYQSAYLQGQNLYYYVTNNPDFNGYNARHIVDWVPTQLNLC